MDHQMKLIVAASSLFNSYPIAFDQCIRDDAKRSAGTEVANNGVSPVSRKETASPDLCGDGGCTSPNRAESELGAVRQDGQQHWYVYRPTGGLAPRWLQRNREGLRGHQARGRSL